jgi:peptide/nickel transport system substrate-binding protein
LLRRLAATSVALGLALAGATRVETARRPRYGGTLRVEIGATISSLDPAAAFASSDEAMAKEQLYGLIYDHRNPDRTFSGPGPFRISVWEPRKRVTLDANDDYRGGRPFVDSIEIQMGRNAHDRLLDLELDKTDFAEIPPDQTRHAGERGIRISASQPDELLALVFFMRNPATVDSRLREAVALAIDRTAIVNFILQKTGEPAGGLLPQWSSGTAFLFPTSVDIPRAKELSSQITPSSEFVLGYDLGDPLEHSVAERIVVNAREAGIKVIPDPIQRSSPPEPSALLVRRRMESQNPRESLVGFRGGNHGAIGIVNGEACEALLDSATPEQVYNCERSIVSSYSVIPLVWLPQVYGLSARVRDWKAPTPGEGWPLGDVWLDGEAP